MEISLLLRMSSKRCEQAYYAFIFMVDALFKAFSKAWPWPGIGTYPPKTAGTIYRQALCFSKASGFSILPSNTTIQL
jgi:hypothetical protein